MLPITLLLEAPSSWVPNREPAKLPLLQRNPSATNAA